MGTQSQPVIADLAGLLRRRNLLSSRISTLINRPLSVDDLHKVIAATLTGMNLPEDVSIYYDARLPDRGSFGRSVRIRWYAHHEGQLELERYSGPDLLLVVAGHSAPGAVAYGLPHSLSIRAIYIFDSKALREVVGERGYKDPPTIQVAAELWEAAEIYPRATSPLLTLTDEQRAAIELFSDVELTL